MRLGLSGDMASACELLCAEDADSLEDSLEDVADAEFPDDSGESIAGFIEGESEYSPGCDYPDRFRSRLLDPFARAESIAWILKVHSYYRFCPLTAYLAVNYMDRFLSSHCLPANEWALQLLAVTCLSLAAKMEETLVPSLLDLQVEEAKYIFRPRTILRMELLVLTALNWRLRSVTPFTFIDFFAYKVDPYGKYMKYLVSRAAQIILATIHADIDFLDHCPSSMAAAAIICAADETPALKFIDPAIASTWCIGLTEEGIRSCYQLMQQIAICSSSIQRRHPVVLSQIRVTTTVNLGSSPPSKRRKLSNGGG
ncbi:cyclin-D2-1-like isoform X3 [Typha angustifolia]|uniref:cyclin-D2-1-like isoform X3 n=1 Tax=Typha angustifolia TaxID=59011 RepID=UPI003C2C6F7F